MHLATIQYRLDRTWGIRRHLFTARCLCGWRRQVHHQALAEALRREHEQETAA